ncbi:ins.2 family protein [Megaselia abdita]
MKFVSFICVLLVCLTFLISKGNSQVAFTAGGKVRLCGESLTKTLTKLCVNGFYSNVKKSVPETYDDDLAVENNFEDEGGLLPFYPNFDDKIFTNKGSLLSKYRRRRNGIVNECCRKQCSINTLLSYCD